MKSLRLLLAAVALCVFSCLIIGCSKKAEQVADTETADQMEMSTPEMAKIKGREAAKAIINSEWKDTMQLQQAILEARAINSKYEIEGNKACKAAFDTAFYNTIRTVRPDLADLLQPSK